MFKVGDIVKYSPRFCGPGEEKYIHEVKEVNPDTGRCLIYTLNTSLTLGSSEWVDEEMIQLAKKYEVIVIRAKDNEQYFLVTDTETKMFFNGYDFMGSVDWNPSNLSCCYMSIEEAEQVLKDLESADEPAEPENMMDGGCHMEKQTKSSYYGQVKLEKAGKWSTVTNECEKENLAQAQINRLLDCLKTPPVGIRIIKATTTYEVV